MERAAARRTHTDSFVKMGPGGVSKPGMKPIQAPLVPLLAVISLPALTSSVSAVAFPESPIVLACVSLSLVYTIVVALGLCYYLQNKAGKMQEGVYFPAISQLGIEAPEQLLYQVGMTLVSTCMVVGVMRMEDTLLPHYFFEKNYTEIVDTQEAFMACRKAGFIAAAGVCIQGIFTLEIKLSTRSFMHWGGTAVFAYGAFNHCDGVMRLLDGVRSPLQDVPAVALSKQVKHVFLEQVPSMLFFLPILGQVLSAAGIGKKEDDAAALTKKDDDAVELKDTRTAQEVREQLPEKAQARLAAYEVRKARGVHVCAPLVHVSASSTSRLLWALVLKLNLKICLDAWRIYNISGQADGVENLKVGIV